MLLTAFRAGAADREAVAGILGSADDVDGLANTYRFDQDGELAASSAGAHVFAPRASAGSRWPGVRGRRHCRSAPPGTYRSPRVGREGRHAYPVATAWRVLGRALTAIARRLGLTLSWRDLPCRRAIRAIADGRLDAALVPARDVPQGTLTSGIALATHVALVASTATRPSPARGDDPLLERSGPARPGGGRPDPGGGRVGRGRPGRSTGAQILTRDDRRGAYEALVAGTISAVADLEPDAWLAIERRPTLCGCRASTPASATCSSPVVPTRGSWPRSTRRWPADPRRTVRAAVREVLPGGPHAAGDGHVAHAERLALLPGEARPYSSDADGRVGSSALPRKEEPMRKLDYGRFVLLLRCSRSWAPPVRATTTPATAAAARWTATGSHGGASRCSRRRCSTGSWLRAGPLRVSTDPPIRRRRR